MTTRFAIRHSACGSKVGWWIGERPPIVGDPVRMESVQKLNGESPSFYEPLATTFYCPYCKRHLQGWHELRCDA